MSKHRINDLKGEIFLEGTKRQQQSAINTGKFENLQETNHNLREENNRLREENEHLRVTLATTQRNFRAFTNAVIDGGPANRKYIDS